MLEIKNLTCGYGTKFILQDIAFRVENKELVGIIGPNGSGKTTMLRAISRVLKPKKGAILFQGKDIWQISPKQLARKVAVVSQSLPTGSMSVEEFVLLGRIPHLDRFQFLERRKDLEITKRSMALTDILRFKHQPIDEISGGERQLALISRALAQKPELLLLDEPTAHLDINHQIEILDLVKRLCLEQSLTVIAALHDLNLAAQYCDWLVMLNGGSVYTEGKPQDVLTAQNIKEVYGAEVCVFPHPINKLPTTLISAGGNTQGSEVSA